MAVRRSPPSRNSTTKPRNDGSVVTTPKTWTTRGLRSLTKNGFPATAREEAEFDRREEQQLSGLAERMGITIHRKQDKIGARVKPNAPCPCGSGAKYKKCCAAAA